MKKILFRFLILVLTFALLLSVNIFADDVIITANVDETYQIKIPEGTTSLTYGVTTAQTFGTVGLQSARLEPNHQVTITVSGNDGLVNNSDNTKKIQYSIMDGESVFTTGNFVDTTLKTLTIVVAQAQWDAAPAGSYSDTVTFTATVTNIVAYD